ncbi:ATP-grasp domain-containing protein [Actinokineospora sp.]|uniref:ATP-grasp domain-containing protein n=1 Tax=Actinokineospora sp. TaxID=1872133 RepID=UPI003D6B7281
MDTTDGVLLLMGSGAQLYREYLVESAARNHRVWLFDPDEPTWQRPYIAGYDVIDVFDPAAVVAAARGLAETVPVLGVYCYHEGVIVAAAEAAAALGLPGTAPEAVRACRDKVRTRELLHAARVPQPMFALVGTIEAATAAAGEIGYPLVIKPRGLGASQGVVKVTGPDELAWALEVTRSATQRGMAAHDEVLMEEYLEGPEISIDIAVFEGRCHPFIVGRKNVGMPPYFEEIGHMVSADDALLTDRGMLDLLDRMHVALGVTHGITHTEIKFGPRGPALIEVNGRLGGDLIPYLGQIASGVDAGDVAIDLALGRAPKLDATDTASASIRFYYPPTDMAVESVTLPAADPDAGLYEVCALAEPGTELRLPPRGYTSRFGYAIARAADPAACTAVLDAADGFAAVTGVELPA